jgi:hypothetical protein
MTMEQVQIKRLDQDELSAAIFYKAKHMGYSTREAQELFNATHKALEQFLSFSAFAGPSGE